MWGKIKLSIVLLCLGYLNGFAGSEWYRWDYRYTKDDVRYRAALYTNYSGPNHLVLQEEKAEEEPKLYLSKYITSCRCLAKHVHCDWEYGGEFYAKPSSTGPTKQFGLVPAVHAQFKPLIVLDDLELAPYQGRMLSQKDYIGELKDIIEKSQMPLQTDAQAPGEGAGTYIFDTKLYSDLNNPFEREGVMSLKGSLKHSGPNFTELCLELFHKVKTATVSLGEYCTDRFKEKDFAEYKLLQFNLSLINPETSKNAPWEVLRGSIQLPQNLQDLFALPGPNLVEITGHEAKTSWRGKKRVKAKGYVLFRRVLPVIYSSSEVAAPLRRGLPSKTEH